MQHLTIETILDYLHGGLDAAEDANAFSHLQSCGDCRTLQDRESRIGESLQAYGHASERDFPESLRTAIFAATRERESPMAFVRKRLFVAVPALGGVAALAVGIVLTLSHAPAGSTPVLQATALLDTHINAAMAMPLADRAIAPTFDSTVGDARDDDASAN